MIDRRMIIVTHRKNIILGVIKQLSNTTIQHFFQNRPRIVVILLLLLNTHRQICRHGPFFYVYDNCLVL